MRALLLASITLLAACDCGRPNTGVDSGSGGSGGGGGDALSDGGGGIGGGAAGGGGGGNTGCIAGATALTITPANPTIAAGAAQTFVVTATVGGQQQDVTSSVMLSLTRDDDSPTGTLSGATLTSASGVGGVVHVTATDGCLSASTDVMVTLSTDITTGDGGVSSTDFGGTLDTTTLASLPRVVYPHDGTRFPRNIYKVLFQWQRATHSRFRLTFTGPGSTVQIFTDGRSPACTSLAVGCWEADVVAWLAIAGSNAGGEVQLTIDGVDAAGGTVFRAPAITLGFSRRDVKGAIFYWSTTSAGIRRATVSDNAPEPYLVAKPIPSRLSDGSLVKCVACHTVSRSGRKLFAYSSTSIDTGGFVYDVTLTPPPTPLITEQITTQKGFGTFSPDDLRVVATVGDKLAEFDSATAAPFGQLPVVEGTNPDWSPLGHELVYSNQGGDSPGNASLAVIARQDGGWGAIRTLVAPGAGLTALFPSYSPDGLRVAYVRGRGGHGDKTFQLWLVGADGGENTELLAANRKVNNCIGIGCDAGYTNGQYENTMPTWAPTGDLDWVAFNSLRPYGVVFPAGGTQQIWVAAIDRSKLGQRLPDGGLVDPSYPAFRFAFQDLNENNHRAFWTLDVRVELDAGTCVAQGQSCTANSTCCGANQCQALSELEYQCLPAGSVDAGTCLAIGAPCSQTSGPACCESPLIACDATLDGGYACMSTIN